MNENPSFPEPLGGIRVVALTHALAGPVCAMLLGDLGADVIKIEPLSGDFLRMAENGTLYVTFNRNMRGLALDLKKEEGRDIALRLTTKAQVLVENYLPGTLDRFGLGYDAIRQINPRIIYCSISGYGQTGPLRDRPGFDPIAQAMSGIMVTTGEPNGPPVRILPAMIDYGAGIHAALAVVLSIMEQQKSGNGQRIDISLLDVAINQMSSFITKYTVSGELPKRMGSGHNAWTPFEAFPTRDGSVLIAVTTDQIWQKFCSALGLVDLANNPRYATLKGRLENRKELVETLRKITHQYESLALESKLSAKDVPCAKLRTIAEIIQEPHVQSRQILENIDYPGLGEFTSVKTPMIISGKSPRTRLKPPLLGEHTKEVLREIGCTPQEIQDLIGRKIVAQKER